MRDVDMLIYDVGGEDPYMQMLLIMVEAIIRLIVYSST